MVLFEMLCGISIAILLLYYYCTSTYDFWKSRGVVGPQPVPLFGNIKDVMFGKLDMNEFLVNLYTEYKEVRFFGIFARRTPILILKCPILIKDVLMKDFSEFAHRGVNYPEKAEPLTQHLFSLEPEKWRPLRTRLSPVFTSGKLREMFPLMLKCAEHLQIYLDKVVSKNEPVDCRELTAKYTTDVIASCAFGVETQSLSDEDSEFRRIGRNVCAPTWSNVLRIKIKQIIPRWYNALGYILPYSEVTKFLTRTVKENIEYREKNDVIRHDFIDMLRELKKHPGKIGMELTDHFLAAQAYVFFIAGFETSSMTMTHALYELALNHKIQDRLREEIDAYVKDANNLTFDNIQKMSYLDKIFKETLRKHPPVIFLVRKSTKNYAFEGTSLSIPKNQMIWIPIYQIQRDPVVYPEPDVFDPERFDEANMQNKKSMFYLPFGDGPRNCIGSRFANYQTKVGLIKILQNYKVETCEKTQISYITDPRTGLLTPKHEILLKITKIDRT